MGIKLADAIVYFKGDLSEMRKSFQSGERETKSAALRMGESVNRILGKGVVMAAGAATAAIGALGAGMVAATLKAASVEGIEDTFYSLADGATLAALRTASMNTVLDADLMKTYNRAVLSVGQTFADELPNAMQYMGTIAAATGQDVDYLLESYQLGIARLSPMILDNLGIQVNLTEANEQYAKQLGINVDELTKEQQQMALNEQVLAMLAERTDGMADSSNNAAVRIRQLKTMFGNFFTQLGTIGLPVLNGFLQFLVPLAEKYVPMLSDFIGRAAGAVGSFVNVIGQGIDPVFAFSKLLYDLGIPQETREAIMEFINGIIQLGTAIGEFVETHAKAIIGAIAGIGAVLVSAGIYAAIVTIGGAIAAIGAPIIATIAIAAALGAAWNTNFLGIRDITIAVWEGSIKPILTNVWNWLSVNVPAALETLRAIWVDTVWPAIQSALQIAWGIIQTVFIAVSEFITGTLIPTVTQLYETWVNEVWPSIETALQNAWTVIETIFSELGRWIQDNLGPWAEALKAIWADEVWPAIESAVENAWKFIQPIWESIREWAEDKLPGAIEGFKEGFTTAMTAIETAISPVKGIWDGLVEAIKGFWDWITGKEFTFEFKLPDLPDWAVPGSPLPIHTAWEKFADDINQLQIAPKMNLEGMPSAATLNESANAASTRLQSQQTVNNYYYLQPQYLGRDEQPDLAAQVRGLQILTQGA